MGGHLPKSSSPFISKEVVPTKDIFVLFFTIYITNILCTFYLSLLIHQHTLGKPKWIVGGIWISVQFWPNPKEKVSNISTWQLSSHVHVKRQTGCIISLQSDQKTIIRPCLVLPCLPLLDLALSQSWSSMLRWLHILAKRAFTSSQLAPMEICTKHK